MAETTETVVFEVDVSSYEKSLAELTKSINTLKTSQKDLQEQTKKGAEGAAESLEKLNAELKVQQQQYRTTQNVLVGYIGSQKKGVDMQNLSNNSIQTNRDLLKQLTAQYITLKNPNEQFTAQIKKLSDTLKQQEGVIGDTRRNVGNYFNEFANGVPVLGQAVAVIGNVGTAFKSAGGGVQGFSAALATTGLPLIIAGVNLLIDAFKTFEPLADAVNDSIAGLSASFSSSYAEGVKLSQLKRQIEINNRNELVTNAELKKSITELEAIAANKAAKDQDRIKSLKEANALREQQLEINKQNLAEDKEALDLEVKLSFESNKSKAAALGTLNNLLGGKAKEVEANKELLKQQKQLEADRVALEEQSFLQQQENRNKIALLEKEIAEDAKAANDAANKANELRTAKEKSESEKRIAQAQKEADEKLKIEQKHAQDVTNLQIEFQLTDRQRIEDSFAAKQALLNASNEEELALINDIETAKQAALKEYDDKIIAQNAKTLAAITAQNTSSYKLDADAYKKEQEAKFQAASTIASAFTALSDAAGKETAAGIAFGKAAALAQIAIDTARSISAGIAGATTSATATGPGAFVATPIFIATTIATIVSAIASATAILSKADTPTPPKFARGGEVVSIDGRPHSQGGTPIHVNGRLVAEAEQGEGLFVMKKNAYQEIDKLSSWNQLHGGVSWNTRTRHAAFGGEIPASFGGYSTREITNSVNDSIIMKQAIREGFAKAPAPELSIVELNAKQNSRSRSISISEL